MAAGSLQRITAAARRRPVEAGLATAAAAFGAVLIAWTARDSWFVFDHWDFLTKRELGSAADLFEPHAGHWQTYTVVLHRVLYAIAGMDFSPWYVIPRALFPSGVALAAFLAMRWRGTPRWLAWPVFGALLFSGVSGWHTSATIGNSLVHMGALATAVLVARTDQPGRGDLALAGLALTVALSASGLGLAVFGGTVLAVAASGRLRRWWPALAVPGAVYAAWYVAYGGGASSALDLSAETLRAAPRFAYDVVSAAVGRVLWASQWPDIVLVAGLGLAVGWAAHRRRLGIFEGILLAAAGVYLPMVVFRRVATGQASAEAIRYAYVLMMLIVPALVPTVRVTRRLVKVGALAVAGVVLVGNVLVLRDDLAEWERIGQSSRRVVTAAADLLLAGEPALPAASPDPPRDGQLTVQGLRRLLDDGWRPQASLSADVVTVARGNIRLLAQEGFRTVERGPRTEAPLDEDGCAALRENGSIEMFVDRSGPISMTGGTGAVVAFEWSDSWGTGVMDVSAGTGPWIVWLAGPGDDVTVLRATAVGASVRVCGLR
jgi:hypothetical protein